MTRSRTPSQQLADAELAQVRLVRGESGGDDGGAGAGGELDGEAADASGRADDQTVSPSESWSASIASIAVMPAQMGHSSIRVTLDLYGHLFPDANRSVLAELDRLIDREPPEASITL